MAVFQDEKTYCKVGGDPDDGDDEVGNVHDLLLLLAEYLRVWIRSFDGRVISCSRHTEQIIFVVENYPMSKISFLKQNTNIKNIYNSTFRYNSVRENNDMQLFPPICILFVPTDDS